MKIKLLKIVLKCLQLGLGIRICVLLLYNHVSDRNIWGIYIEGNHLLIGDFWATLYIIWFIFKGFSLMSGRFFSSIRDLANYKNNKSRDKHKTI